MLCGVTVIVEEDTAVAGRLAAALGPDVLVLADVDALHQHLDADSSESVVVLGPLLTGCRRRVWPDGRGQRTRTWVCSSCGEGARLMSCVRRCWLVCGRWSTIATMPP